MDPLLLVSLFLLPAFGEPIPDYDDPYAPIFTDKPVYSWTDKIKMTIIAPSWNSNKNLIDSIGGSQSHPIKISTRGHSLEPYRFTETGVNSGIFTAEVTLTGFSHDADGDGDIDTNPRTAGGGPTSGFLESDRDSAVTISFEFADGVVLTESVPVLWNIGTIQFLEDVSLEGPAMIRVIDPDMNLNPEGLDSVPVRIISDSDVAGITVSAVETSESTGSFVAKVSFTQTLQSSGNRLLVLPGDQVSAAYDDHTMPRPFSTSESLTLDTSANVDSSVLPVERIGNSEIAVFDSLGNPLESVSANNRIQVTGTVSNNQDFAQKFVYLFQVKNSNDVVESISWTQGELSSRQSLDVSKSWIPKNPGTYQLETFVWDSLADPVALSQVMSGSITVE